MTHAAAESTKFYAITEAGLRQKYLQTSCCSAEQPIAGNMFRSVADKLIQQSRCPLL
jgi:hypothetical protein